jgi:hypothetical protein
VRAERVVAPGLEQLLVEAHIDEGLRFARMHLGTFRYELENEALGSSPVSTTLTSMLLARIAAATFLSAASTGPATR